MTDHERRINEAHDWPEDVVRKLFAAIVIQAVRDYLNAHAVLTKPLPRNPTETEVRRRWEAKRRAREIDIFFASDWFRQISELDPVELREKLVQMAKAGKGFPRGVKKHE